MHTPLAVSAAEAARLLGISRSQLYLLLQRHELPSRTMGRRRLFVVEDLQHWLASLPASALVSDDRTEVTRG